MRHHSKQHKHQIRRKKITSGTIRKMGCVLKIHEETLRRIASLWKRGKSTREIGEELNMTEGKVCDTINQMLTKQSCRTSPNQKPSDEFLHAAVKPCIICRNEFWSPHRRQIHMCDVCKSRATPETEDFEFATGAHA